MDSIEFVTITSKLVNLRGILMKNHRLIQKPISQGASLIRKVGRSMDIARSRSISHFAPRTASTTTKPITTSVMRRKLLDIGPIRRPVANKLVAKPEVTKSAKVIKEEAIAEAFKKLSDTDTTQRSIFRRYSKFVNIFSVSIVLIAIIGYAIYYNMPVIQVRIASAQAGIDAKYPEYHPDGYSLSGPVSYSDDQVTINFHANTGSSEFIIKQSKSSWDSTAVKDWVDNESKGAFNESKDKGLTIYTYGGNAAWVNGGILYSITGDAPLSGEQIRRIATSL